MARSKHGTLVAGVVTPVTITDSYPHGITIINRTPGAGPISYRLDGVDPVIGADDTFICLDAVFVPHPADGEGYTPTTEQEAVEVRLRAASAVDFTVEGNPVWKRV